MNFIRRHKELLSDLCWAVVFGLLVGAAFTSLLAFSCRESYAEGYEKGLRQAQASTAEPHETRFDMVME